MHSEGTSHLSSITATLILNISGVLSLHYFITISRLKISLSFNSPPPEWMRPPPPTTTAINSATAHSLDLNAFGHLIHHCSQSPALFNVGRQLHARLVLHSIVPSNFLASKLLSLYSRCGHLTVARKLFDEIPQKNLFSYNAMLIAYSLHSHDPYHCHQLFASMPWSLKPDAFTLSSLLKSVSCISTHKEIHGFSVRNGILDSDLFVANGLIAGYAKMGHSRYARLVFDLMPERDIVSWNSIISGYSQAGNYDECLGLFFEMVKGLDGVMPNGVTVASMLHACSQMKDLAMGTRVHQFAVKSEIEMDAMLWNSVIGFYAKCARLEYARSLFDEMQYKDAVSYNVMITGYMAHGFVDKAMNLFNRMANSTVSSWNAVIAGLVQNNQHSDALSQVLVMQDLGFRPNSITLSSILPAISFFSNLLAGKQVHGYAIRSDFDQNIYVTSALIDIYAKSGFLAGARCVFERTKGRSLIVWTAIISAYASHGDADNAIIMFNRMLDNGIEPDPVTFTAVLSACAHAGAVNEARKIYKMMSSYEISPAMEQYACMVGVFSRQGMLEEAMELISKMPGEPNAKIWGSLLNGAATIGDVEFGKFVYQKLVQIEPENTGNYIVMANLYSRVGRWEEAKIVREKLKGIGLSKIPGCSWIEMSYGLQVFVAKDASNERSDEIYMVLDGLIGLMREEGYVSEAEIDEESCF